MFCREEIKEKSKEQLRGRWGAIGGLYLIVFLIYLVLEYLPDKFFLATLILSGPLVFGEFMVSLKVSRREEAGVEEIFSGFGNFGRSLGLYLWALLWGVLWSLLLIIPGIIKGYSYSMAFYVLIDHPEMSVREALKESIAITDGYKMDLFIMDLSFIGWVIASIFTLGIGFFWLFPYMQTCWANAYETIKQS